MKTIIIRCTLAFLMCGFSSIGMAQVIFSEYFTGYTNNQAASIDGWTFYKCMTRTTNFWSTSILSIEKTSPSSSDKGYAITPKLDYIGDIERAREMFLTFFCVAHGLASLLANNSMEYDEEQIKKMLENVFFGMAASGKGK